MGKKLHISRKMWICAGIASVFLIGGCLVWIWPSEDFNIQQMDYNMITRIQEKIWKVVYSEEAGLLLDRGMDKLLYYPQYLLYGARCV